MPFDFTEVKKSGQKKSGFDFTGAKSGGSKQDVAALMDRLMEEEQPAVVKKAQAAQPVKFND